MGERRQLRMIPRHLLQWPHYPSWICHQPIRGVQLFNLKFPDLQLWQVGWNKIWNYRGFSFFVKLNSSQNLMSLLGLKNNIIAINTPMQCTLRVHFHSLLSNFGHPCFSKAIVSYFTSTFTIAIITGHLDNYPKLTLSYFRCLFTL